MVRRPQGGVGSSRGGEGADERVGYGREPWGPAEGVAGGFEGGREILGVGAQMNGVGYRGEPWGPASLWPSSLRHPAHVSHPGPSLVPTFRPRRREALG